MNFKMVNKIKTEELKNIFKLIGLKVTSRKKNLLQVTLWQWTNNVPERAAEELLRQ